MVSIMIFPISNLNSYCPISHVLAGGGQLSGGLSPQHREADDTHLRQANARCPTLGIEVARCSCCFFDNSPNSMEV